MDREELEDRISSTYNLMDRVASRSIFDYLRNVVIDSRPEPERFGRIADRWQWEVYSPVANALEVVSGLKRGRMGEPTSFWRTLSRGSDKTGMIGRMLNWLLAYSKKRLSMSVAAGDNDQAKLLTKSMYNELQLNPWLRDKVEWGQKVLRGPGGELKVLTAEASTSFGLTDDVVVCDELTNWANDDLWKVLWSGREKRPGSVFIVITNAGTRGSWQWDIHARALSDETWDVFDAPGPLASWMTPDAILRLRNMLPRGFARRVIDNVWIDPAEDADFLTRHEIELCSILGKSLGLIYTTKGQKGVRYVAGIDYGPKRDRTALCVLHLDQDIVVIDRLDVWQGRPDYPIPIERVEEWMRQISKDFNSPLLVCDPYQMEGTVQEFELNQEVERFEARGGKRTYEMAEHLRTLIANRRIAWYPDAGAIPVSGRLESLEDELCGLVLKITPYGYRFDHTARFHDDRAVSIGMASLMAARMDPSMPGVAPGEIVKPRSLDFRRGGWERRGLWGV